MSTDNHLTTSPLNDFPIAIGVQPSAEHESAVTPATNAQSDSMTNLAGYDLVADMMEQQDDILAQLDDLNTRIELTINEISAARKSEI